VLVSSFPYAINWSVENVPAILHITQSSQELGNGLADILFGKESPAGRLVQTWPSSIEHLPPMLDYNIRNGRTYMYSTNRPLFAFGHGLTYTSFSYENLRLNRETVRMSDTLEVSLTVHNKGRADSDEVVQVYVTHPESKVERPLQELKGFRRVHIPAGSSRQVSVSIPASELAYWNVERQAFTLEPGPIEIRAGSASDRIHLTVRVMAE
jgi:beta-glucosidase